MEASNDARHDAPRRAPRLETIATPTRGAAVYLQTLLPTRCLPMPQQRDVDEYVYLLHGDLDVWIAGRHAKLRAGMSVVLPARVEHRIGNFGERPAKVLIVAANGCVPTVRVAERPSGLGAGSERVSAVVTPAGVDVVFC